MNFKTITRRQFWSLALLVGLVFAILVSLTLVRQRQDIRKRAEVPATSPVTPTPGGTSCLTLPAFDTFSAPNLDTNLWNEWVGGNGLTMIIQEGGLLKTSVTHNKIGILSPSPTHAGVITKQKVCGDFDVSVDFSGFTSSGQSEGDARLSVEDQSTNSSIFIERFSKGNSQGFSIKKVINGQPTIASDINSFVTSGKMRIRRVGAVYSLYYDAGNGWQSTGGFGSGFTADAQIAILVKSFDQNPSVSVNFDNFNLTEAVLDPSITSVPPTPTWSPTPTPPSGREKYTIDIGDKQSLVFQIGPAINSQIKFKAKLASVSNTPDLYLRLRVKDELAFMNSQNYQNTSSDTCNNPNLPDRDLYVPMKATGGVYAPVAQISSPAPTGATVATVTPDGWVILEGIVPGRYYTLYLKGPKTRKGKMIEHFLLQPNQNSTQDFDWTGKPLDPGDLPNPDKDMKQDCTINSTDWSLIKKYIGSNKTDAKALDVADVNYSGEVNALDSINILSTLSKKPDDD